MIRSAPVIVDSRCAIIKVVLPLAALSMACWISFSVWVSMLAVASSRTKMAGSWAMARAKEINP
ncbi:hypothetical protein [Paenibacillus graminis]|uniref:hypothetical protein n=1 Tax=Paenibacillus graminis TaxID=189425 RepID=UPI00398B79FA